MVLLLYDKRTIWYLFIPILYIQICLLQQTLEASPAYNQFISSLRSKATKRDYAEALRDFLKFLKHDSCDQVLTLEPKQIQLLLIQYIVDMRDTRKLAPNSINARINGVQSFLQINDIEVNWNKVKKFKGEQFRVAEDRPYSRDEIATLVNAARSLRDKAIILLLATSGIRIGALLGLQLKHLRPIKYNMFQVSVYQKAKEQYITFCTPECRKAIDDYLQWRERLGEKITPESPLFRLEFNTRMLSKVKAPAKSITYGQVVKFIRRLRASVGIVEQQHETESIKHGSRRTEIMTSHGFRKYFSTTLETEGVNPVYVELLLGHDMGLKTVYSKPTAQQLLEGNGNKVRGYISGINALTIDDANRLRIENASLKETQAEWFKNREEMIQIRKRLEEIDIALGVANR